MPTTNIAPYAKQRFFDAVGLPLAGGKLFTYAAGTTTKQNSYTDSTGATPNTNPIILDAAGYCNLWLDQSLAYKLTLSPSTDTDPPTNPIWTVDQLNTSASPVLTALAASSGSSLVGFIQSGGSAVARTVQAELRGKSITPNDFGATGGADDTTAVQAAFNDGRPVIFEQDYNVTTVTYSGSGRVDFNGHFLVGVASVATSAIFVIKSVGATLIDVRVKGGVANTSINTNYTCAIWWYWSTGASQYNDVFGMNIIYTTYGLVYGVLPGGTSTDTYAQSENSIHGFRTRGVQNPYYNNHANGFLFFTDPIFVSLNNEWPVSPAFSWATARAFDNQNGTVITHGGEVQLASSTGGGYAANLNQCKFFGTNFEVNTPIQQTGDGIYLNGCQISMTIAGVSMFSVASFVGATGQMDLNDCNITRANVGAGEGSPMIAVQGGANAANTININGGRISKWRWVVASPYSPLVQQGVVCNFNNVEYSDSLNSFPVCRLSSIGSASIFPAATDIFGYATTGWTAASGGGTGGTLSSSSVAGPTNYLAKQLSIVANTGSSTLNVTSCDVSSGANVIAGGFKCRPTETYFFSAWVQAKEASSNMKITADFYDSAGAFVSTVNLMDSSLAPVIATWYFVYGPFRVPATCAYFAIKLQSVGDVGASQTMYATDIRVFRATQQP